MDKADGTPEASRHLRPAHMPTGTTVPTVVADHEDELDYEAMYAELEKLREPFSQTEKLPKPMWKAAWDGESKSRCDICGGYHVLVNTLHLDYVGHAEVTKRLLDVDPLWNWEPLALDGNGLPKFDGFGGMWIKLTVCGVTRLGYGDATGKDAGSTAVKEIIGDAIRNAAMRFGVALDLWSKLDSYEGKNPSATTSKPRQQQGSRGRDATDDRPRTRGRRGVDGVGDGQGDSGAEAPRAANQDALDALQDVCNEYGYSTQYCINRWADEHDGEHIKDGDPDGIFAFAEKLLIEATPEPADGPGQVDGDDAGAGAVEGGAVAGGVPATDDGADEAQAGPPPDPEDTSDVEKKPGEMF